MTSSLLCLTALLSSSPSAFAGETPPEFHARLERMRSTAAALQQYTYTLYRHEWVDGEQADPQEMAIKFRKPMDIYVVWTGEVYKGRELIYRKGWNNGKMRVHPTPGALIPSLNIAPDSRLAMRGSRNGIELIDIGNVVDLILAQTDRVEANPDLQASFTDLGARMVNGEPSHCLKIELPKDKDPALYAYRVDMCISDETGLPNRLESWDFEDGAMRKVAHYEFRDLNTHVTLTDADFDPDNAAYGF